MVKTNMNNLLVAFIFIDILILPNYGFFVMPISLPFVIGAILLNKIKIKQDRELLVFIVLSLLVLTSVLLSFIQSPLYLENINVWMENIKRAFQLLTSFGYYFLLKNCFPKSDINIKKILFTFIAAYICLGIISLIDVAAYFRVLDFLGVGNPFVNKWFVIQSEYLFRYSFIWIDPNNAAYGFQMVAFYLLLNGKLKPLEKIAIYISVIISLILGMSTGALLSAVLFFSVIIILKVTKLLSYTSTNERIIKSLLGFSFGFVIIVILSYYFRDSYAYVKSYSLGRMLENTDGGRLNIYSSMFKDKLPNLIGEGYTQIRDDNFFRPHSDHLRFLYSYGIVAYLISIWFFFRKAVLNSRYLFVIPGFMAYSINSLIDEQKILIILLILIAHTNYLTKNKKQM